MTASANYSLDESLRPVDRAGQQSRCCYHCEQPVAKGVNYQFDIKGESRLMCCMGCVAAATMITDAQLDGYYDFREISGHRPTEASDERPISAHHSTAKNLSQRDELAFEAYAKADYLAQYSRLTEQGFEVELIFTGIRCAACIWLLEQYLLGLTGVKRVSIDLASHRGRFIFDQPNPDIVAIFTGISQLGYQAYPYVAGIEEQLFVAEKQQMLKALGVSFLGVMQVMTLTIALYAGAFDGIDPAFESLLRWASLIVATPVVLYSARLFFVNAWRDLKLRRMGMDLPVSLAIGAAYGASLLNTVWLNGEVYYESVSMFTFFLLLSRFIELNARAQRAMSSNAMVSVLPSYALRYASEGQQADIGSDIASAGAGQPSPQRLQTVLLKELQVGDLILVKNGALIPADGLLRSEYSQIDESAFSGESLPLSRQRGDQLYAGSVNVLNPITVEITAIPEQSLISSMVQLSQRAAADKPAVALLADKVAGYFVAVVLLIAVAAGCYWYSSGYNQMFTVVLSVLVVSCPCALSLATPLALTVANRRAMLSGVMPTSSRLLGGLADVDTIMFDKTGTLTDGQLALVTIEPLANINQAQLLALAVAIEHGISHPLAESFAHAGLAANDGESISHEVSSQQVHQAMGVAATIANKRYYLGKPAFVGASLGVETPSAGFDQSHTITVLLASEDGLLGWFVFADQLKKDALATVAQLTALGLDIHLVSGDAEQSTKTVAQQLSLSHYQGGMSPEDKLTYLRQLTAQGRRVLMVGDGINDAAVLKQAYVSVAMSNASEFVQAKADGVMLHHRIPTIAGVIRLAHKTRRIVGQNVAWALAYNLVTLPLAAMGLIAPWLAALGMSLSSLLVLLNSHRLNSHRLNSHRLNTAEIKTTALETPTHSVNGRGR